MIGKIEFPEGVTHTVQYLRSADLLLPDFDSFGSTSFLYGYAKGNVIKINFDTSNVTDMSYMFYYASVREIYGEFDTSNVTNMSYMFSQCSSLTKIPQLNTQNVTNMSYMFYYDSALSAVPSLNTQNVTNMSYMFYNCGNLSSVGQFDMSNVTNVQYMFYTCKALKSIPDMNTIKLQNFGSSNYNAWLYDCNAIESIGVLDCDSITSVTYMLGNNSRTYLTHLGGFRNLGKYSSLSGTNGTSFMTYAPNLTYESVMNVINLLYDRAANGLSNLILKLHANHMAMLSDDDIAIATNKGWTLTA